MYCDYVHRITPATSCWVGQTLTSLHDVKLRTHRNHHAIPVLGHEPRWVARSGQFAGGCDRYVIVKAEAVVPYKYNRPNR